MSRGTYINGRACEHRCVRLRLVCILIEVETGQVVICSCQAMLYSGCSISCCSSFCVANDMPITCVYAHT